LPPPLWCSVSGATGSLPPLRQSRRQRSSGMKARSWWFSALFALVVFSLAALAQDTGQLTGTVHDASGAAVANAQVVVSNASQGINRPTTSNSTGDWLVGGLPGGTYDVSITA